MDLFKSSIFLSSYLTKYSDREERRKNKEAFKYYDLRNYKPARQIEILAC